MIGVAGKDYRYWADMRSTREFERGLRKVPRDYYMGIVRRYGAKTFLDLGCGFGETYNLFRESGLDVRYIGIDVTPGFIKISKERYPGTEFMTGHIEHIPFPDDCFDLASCRCVLEHLPDPEPAIREMARVSTKAIIVVWFRWPAQTDRRVYKKAGYWLNDYPRTWMIDLVRSIGLTLEDEITEQYHLVWVMRHG